MTIVLCRTGLIVFATIKELEKLRENSTSLPRIKRASKFIVCGGIVGIFIGGILLPLTFTYLLYTPIGYYLGFLFLYFFTTILSLLHVLTFTPSTSEKSKSSQSKSKSTEIKENEDPS